MSSVTSLFRLILVHDSSEEADRLLSMLKNAGKPCHAQHVSSESSFNKCLKEQSWDLVIAQYHCTSLSPAMLIRTIRKFGHESAVILLADEKSDQLLVDGLKLGACDVAQVDDDQHLLLLINRELEHHQHRKLMRNTQRKLKELTHINRNLLGSSKDGIAFVQDGMYLYANQSFASMLGHQDKNSIEFMPVMDAIKDSDHANVKKKLKNFALQLYPEQGNQLAFTVILPDGSEKKLVAELFIAEHEGEVCTQLICYARSDNRETMEAELKNIKYRDAITGLYNRTYLMEELEKVIDDVSVTTVPKALIFIDIDRFSKKVKNTLNIADSDKLIKKISGIIAHHYNKGNIVSRVSDHAFAIISEENDPGVLLEINQKLCKKIESNLFDVGKKTLQLTLSIGICIINETATDAQTLMQHAFASIEQLRKNQGGNGANIYQKKGEHNEILVGSFKKALTKDAFSLLFQPILSLRGDETERYEILLRMLIDEKIVSPTQFLSIAGALNVSKNIDRWVILESIKLLRKIDKNKIKMTQQFINLTPASLCDDTLLPWVKVAVEASAIHASNIVFQATEADVIQHLTVVRRFVEQAKEMGIEFSISNFGSVSSEPMATLEHVNAKYVKVHSAFSRDLQENPDSFETLEALVNALHDDNRVTTIPYIEKANILSRLWQLGVYCIQGNYLQPPSPQMNYEFSTESSL